MFRAVVFLLLAGCTTPCPCELEMTANRHAYLQTMAENDALLQQVAACKFRQRYDHAQ